MCEFINFYQYSFTQWGLLCDVLGVMLLAIEWKLNESSMSKEFPVLGNLSLCNPNNKSRSLTDKQIKDNIKSERRKKCRQAIGWLGVFLLVIGFSMQFIDTF